MNWNYWKVFILVTVAGAIESWLAVGIVSGKWTLSILEILLLLGMSAIVAYWIEQWGRKNGD